MQRLFLNNQTIFDIILLKILNYLKSSAFKTLWKISQNLVFIVTEIKSKLSNLTKKNLFDIYLKFINL